jgi:transcriptional regulator with XRE-family HTH domain
LTLPRTPGQEARERDRQAFGALLRNARRVGKLSQAGLAKIVNISPVFVSQIETGQRLPSDRVAKDIAIALDLPWDEVLRRLYRLRSPEADGLFANENLPTNPLWRSVSEIPGVRFLLLQLAGLNLSSSDVEALVRNWASDIALIREIRKANAQ